MLLQQIAKWGEADVIVYVGCGERGNELAEIINELPSSTILDRSAGCPNAR